MNPKVFLSHAKEDKNRFVIDFAEKLRNNGIDVWLDKWEMLRGDSLMDKIFEEGLKNAEAIIIVLSNHSVNKPWVKEELNAGMMKKISKHISYKEATGSNYAKRYGIKNKPSDEQVDNMKLLAKEVFEPLREWVDAPIKVNSMFRSLELNSALKGSKEQSK